MRWDLREYCDGKGFVKMVYPGVCGGMFLEEKQRIDYFARWEGRIGDGSIFYVPGPERRMDSPPGNDQRNLQKTKSTETAACRVRHISRSSRRVHGVWGYRKI